MFPNLVNQALGTITKALGESVSYQALAGGPLQVIKGVFNTRYQAIDPETQVVVTTEQPNLLVRQSDLAAAPVEGDSIVIRSVTYKVHDWHNDGEGGSLLLLHKA